MDSRAEVSVAEVERVAGMATWVWYPETGALQWSEALESILPIAGATQSVATLESCLDVTDRDAFRARLEETAAKGVDLVAEYRVPVAASLRWVQCQAKLDDDPDGGSRVIGIFRDITSERAFLDELAEAAIRDPLTGLLNRFAITDRLEHALERLRRQERQVAVMFVDLDGLKAVNDRLGHRVGDDVLRAVGARLTQAVRHEDSVGRYGGDEFIVVCEDIETPRDALLIAHRIVALLDLESSDREESLAVTSSVGVTAARRGDDITQVLARSDAAMYEAKRDGGGRVVFRH